MLSSLPLLSSLPAPRRRPALPAFLLALLGLCVLGHAANANTLTVATDGSGQYATIQAAINASASGDTVLLADGVYRGPGNVDLNFGGKNITVTSQHGASKTVIDCGGYYASDGSGDHRGFVLQTGVISGLTIQNGYVSGIGYGDGGDTSYSDGQGGDIEVLGDGVFTVQNCVLQNSTAKFGGGLYTSGTATLTNDAFTGNSAQDGGGLFTNGTATLTDCTLTGDTAQDTGGGLYNGGMTTLTNCALTGNTVQYDGGGIYNQSYSGGTLTLTNDTLTGNTAGEYGGGLGNAQAGVATLTNDTLTGNSAQKGGGLYNFGSTATLTNDTLTGNTAQKGGGGLYNGYGGTVGLTNDILYGDMAPNGGEVLNDQTYGISTASATHCDIAGGVPRNVTNKGGNINADPLFVNPPADLHLQPGSPCLGAGTPNGAPALTIDGRLRPNPPSIGAYEGSDATFQVYAVNATSPTGQTVLLSAALTKPGGVGLAGATITFSVDGMAAGSGVTNKNGDASTHYLLPASLSPGSHTLTATFAGDGTNPASSGSATLTVTAARLPGSVVTVGARVGKAGTTVVLKSTLKTPSGAALSGRTLTYTVNGVSAGSAVTDGTGLASLTYMIPAGTPAGNEPIVVSFSGDSGEAPSSGKGTLTVK